MAQFVLKINLGNDAMTRNLDVGVAIMQVGDMVIHEGCGEGEHAIRDNNGNTVGFYEVIS
jgi:hypothetical protein